MSGSQIAFALTLVVCLIGVVVFLVSRAQVEKEINVAIVAAAGTVLASVVVVSITQFNTKLMEVAESHRLKKIEVYSEFGDMVFSIFRMIKIPERAETEEEKARLLREAQANLEERYSSFSKKLVLWGSPDVINSWLEFMARSRRAAGQEGGEAATRAAI